MVNDEYYPKPCEILKALGEECILVGSATSKPLEQCKDLDFVVSQKGLDILNRWKYFLVWDSLTWVALIPYNKNEHKPLEFFGDIEEIADKGKWSTRLTYNDAAERDLKVAVVYGVEVLSL